MADFVVRRGERLRSAGAGQRPRPGAARDRDPVRLQGQKVRPELGKTEITLRADDEFRAASVKDLLLTKAVRRGLSLKVFDWGKLEPAAGGTVRQRIGLQRGPERGTGEGDLQACPRPLPEGEADDPGRRGAGYRQEQGRAAGGDHRPARPRLRRSPSSSSTTDEGRAEADLDANSPEPPPPGRRAARARVAPGDARSRRPAALIGHAITMNSGASDYYAGGVICYSNLAKEITLGVPHELIEAHGAVSEEVAAALAVGAAHRFETELGLSVTGIAGPEGGERAEADRDPLHRRGASRSPRAGRAPRLHPRSRRQPGGGRPGRPASWHSTRRPAPLMRPGERIHLIGIAGSGAAGVGASAPSRRGADRRLRCCRPLAYTQPLDRRGIRVIGGHDPAHLAGVDRVAISAALRAVA